MILKISATEAAILLESEKPGQLGFFVRLEVIVGAGRYSQGGWIIAGFRGYYALLYARSLSENDNANSRNG
ncbi:MAG: hypothetical protein NZ697_04010 [Porticoccaceae bacterium]|nr:hypothetical protein [Porticoccaceae bacterium]